MGSNHGKQYRSWDWTHLGSDHKLCNPRKVTGPILWGGWEDVEIICLKSWHWSMAYSKCHTKVTVRIMRVLVPVQAYVCMCM